MASLTLHAAILGIGAIAALMAGDSRPTNAGASGDGVYCGMATAYMQSPLGRANTYQNACSAPDRPVHNLVHVVTREGDSTIDVGFRSGLRPIRLSDDGQLHFATTQNEKGVHADVLTIYEVSAGRPVLKKAAAVTLVGAGEVAIGLQGGDCSLIRTVTQAPPISWAYFVFSPSSGLRPLPVSGDAAILFWDHSASAFVFDLAGRATVPKKPEVLALGCDGEPKVTSYQTAIEELDKGRDSTSYFGASNASRILMVTNGSGDTDDRAEIHEADSNAKAAKRIAEFKAPDQIWNAAISADGRSFALQLTDEVRLLNVGTMGESRMIDRPMDRVFALGFLNSALVVLTQDGLQP